MYIVYTSHGQYSDYCLDDILVGDVDPAPVLDAAVLQLSDGRWRSKKAMEEDVARNWRNLGMSATNLRDDILKSLPGELKRVGFKVAENTMELHCDD